MSLLSSTQGTPDRVLSLIRVLAAHSGALPREELLTWINPSFARNGTPRSASKDAASQTWGATSSLGLAVAREGAYVLRDPQTDWDRSVLADAVHDRLCSIDENDPDAVIFQVFAYIAVRSQQEQGIGWLHALSRRELADAVETHLTARDDTATDGRRFNDTKIAPFWRWIAFLGLSVDLPVDGDHPYVAGRLSRELARTELPIGEELPGDTIVKAVADRMPYLDGGAGFLAMADRMNVRRSARLLSPLLSTALRDLHEEGRITIGVRGDAADLITLAPDRFSSVSTVQFITIQAARVHD